MTAADRTPSDRAPAATRDPRQAPPLRLIATLTVAGLVTGLLLVVVARATEPAIRAHKQRVLGEAIREVLGQPERFEVLVLRDGALRAASATGEEASDAERVYRGYDSEGRPVGVAIVSAEPGFQDVVRLIFGYEPESRRLLGMKVLESKETPGLGDKIEKDEGFTGQFAGALAPLVGVKPGRGKSADPSSVDMITGATISSRAVVRIINNALERLGPALEGLPREGGP